MDEGPFFHGTKADLRVGDLLTAGFRSNYRPDVVMNHIYFTALRDGAGLAAELAAGEGAPRVYVVEPTGAFEDDPNVTDKKFPGNPTRSYRSREPLRIVGEVTDWTRLTPEALQAWRDRLAAIRADRTRRDHQLIAAAAPVTHTNRTDIAGQLKVAPAATTTHVVGSNSCLQVRPVFLGSLVTPPLARPPRRRPQAPSPRRAATHRVPRARTPGL